MKVKMSKGLRNKLDAAKETDEFWVDSAKLDFALALENWRKNTGKSYNEVAISIKTSPAYISKVFRGDANLTIESMVKLARGLGCHLDFKLSPENKKVESMQFSFEAVNISPTANANIFDNFVANINEGQMGALCFPEYSEPCNDDLYQHAA